MDVLLVIAIVVVGGRARVAVAARRGGQRRRRRACLAAGLHGDSPGPALTAARQELLLGCLDRGELKSVCECAGDEVLRRIDRSPERFAALERDMVRRQNAGQGPPALVLDAARACA